MAGDNLTGAEKQTLIKLARDTLTQRINGKDFPEPGEYQLTERLKQESGAFVSLHKNGSLRGCIGYIEPIAPLFKSIMDNVESAALRDRRFKPVTAEELAKIKVEISVLSVPRPVASHVDIKIGKHGVILQKGWHRAVYLPQVAPEQGWDVEETLSHLSIKAGLPSDGWRKDAEFSVFEAIVFKESDASIP